MEALGLSPLGHGHQNPQEGLLGPACSSPFCRSGGGPEDGPLATSRLMPVWPDCARCFENLLSLASQELLIGTTVRRGDHW